MYAYADLRFSPNKKHRNTGCIIKCAPLRADCQQCADRGGWGGGYQERHWHRKDFPHWRKAFYFSHSDSLWMWRIILSTQRTGCLNAVNYYPIMICFSVDSQDFFYLVLLLNWKEETGQHTRVGYIRDRTLHCYCCFILLTQPGKQPTLALSIQAHRLQRDPDSSAHTSASDKGSHCAIGDGVKTVIHDKASAGRAHPRCCRGDIQSVPLNCTMLSAHRGTASSGP